MPQEIEIREATEKDEEAIYKLSCALATAVGDSRPDSEAVKERLLELLDVPSARTLVAEGEEGILGVMSFWVKPDLAHGDLVVEIPMLAVAEEARRQGVGKLLIQKAQEVASEHGASLIELIATPGNTSAREFYRSLGFVETDNISLEFRGDVEDPPDSDKKS
ncbi:MAG: GNAT family N-acetyltransferase [Rubrobacteraceae bacterium]